MGDYENIMDPKTRKSVGSLASWTGIFINVLLVLGKIVAGLFAGSLAVVADGLNNLMDGAGSIITLVGLKMAAKKADDEHPHGHGRYEYIAGLAVAVLVLVVGIELASEAGSEIISPSPVSFWPCNSSDPSCVGSRQGLMATFYRSSGARIDSSPLKAVAVDKSQ